MAETVVAVAVQMVRQVVPEVLEVLDLTAVIGLLVVVVHHIKAAAAVAWDLLAQQGTLEQVLVVLAFRILDRSTRVVVVLVRIPRLVVLAVRVLAALVATDRQQVPLVVHLLAQAAAVVERVAAVTLAAEEMAQAA